MKKKTLLPCLLSLFPLFSGSFGCSETAPAPKSYADAQLTTTAWWPPYEISEESFQLYKDAGLNTVLFANHSRIATDETWSDNHYYLGSNLTKSTLDMCKKMGLNAIIGEGKWYYDQGDTPFTDNAIYGDYADIIKGVHICDEPSANALREWCSDTRIQDFKQAYADLPYIVNLHPITAAGNHTGTLTYEEYLRVYEECLLENFPANPYISVDFYPFHDGNAANTDNQWISCYEQISTLIAKYDAEANFFIQTAEGNEFKQGLTEADIRYQVYVALCFGGSSIAYYCYVIPGNYDTQTNVLANPMYTACILDKEGNPTHLYDYVKEINKEIQAFAPALRAYSFKKCMPVCVSTYGAENFKPELYTMNTVTDFSDRKYLANVQTKGNCLVGCFERDEDEGYMLVNYGYPNETAPLELTLTLKNGATHVAVYGGDGYSGTPTVLAAKKGKLSLTLDGGEGKFIVPLK